MIVSHRHRFIFLAVPRTATHSMRRALRAHLHEDDWEQQLLNGRQSVPVPALARIGHGHISARQAAAHLPPRVWDRYFKFAFVRDPFDRFVSACSFLNRGNPSYPGRETAFMKGALANPRFRSRVLITPQAGLLCGADGERAVDYVGRYENLQSCFDEVCRHVGIPAATLTPVNASAHGNRESYYDANLESAAAAFYHADFRIFGYAPGLESRREAGWS